MKLIVSLNKNIFKNERFMELLAKLTDPEHINEPTSKYFTLEIREEDMKECPQFLKDRVSFAKI